MMKTSLNVVMVLTVCAILFSGCTKYVYMPCKAEKPLRSSTESCKGKSPMEFSMCAQSKYIVLEGDYEILSKTFDSCK